jgi:SAM-dependent methyltransferase
MVRISEMAQPSERCPACNSDRRSWHGEKNSHEVFRCRKCGTLYSERFEISYDCYYDDTNLKVPEFIRARLDEVFEELGTYRQTNRLLDIGCGAGSLLEAARRAGWDAEGLEISEPAAEFVRTQGFKVFRGDLLNAPYPDDHFDIVTASELIEHVADPLTMLKKTARILRSGGLLWATTPNANSLSSRMLGVKWSTVCPPEHLQLFSPSGIRELTEKAGFRHVKLTSRGCNPFEIWHGLRDKQSSQSNGSHPSEVSPVNEEAPASEAAFDRVSSSYHLNETMLSNPLTRGIKSAANVALGLTGLGDTIRIQAEK